MSGFNLTATDKSARDLSPEWPISLWSFGDFKFDQDVGKNGPYKLDQLFRQYDQDVGKGFQVYYKQVSDWPFPTH